MTESMLSPVLPQGRPRRRQAPPAYLSDYQVDSHVGCRQHSVSTQSSSVLVYDFLVSLQSQISGLLQSFFVNRNDEDIIL